MATQQRGMWADPGNYRDRLIDNILDIDASLESAG